MSHPGHTPWSDEQWAEKLMEMKPVAIKVATKWMGDAHTAEDIVHDIIARLFVKGPFIPEVSLEAVVVQSTKNRCRELHRWQERHPSASMTLDDGSVLDAEDAHPDALATFLQKETTENVVKALGKLTPRHRLILILHYLEDIPFKQIAAELGLPLSTVYNNHDKALGQLARILKKGGVHV